MGNFRISHSIQSVLKIVKFLLAGIGIDDTFVMLAAWRRTPITLPVPERMGRMLAEAAVSITITSVTDVLSFWIGLASTFPSVQIFCLYTGKK
jgi:patched domain-containing protein